MSFKAQLNITLTGGLFLFLDQLLKYYARLNPDFTWYAWQPWLGWEFMKNPGIAFGLPLPTLLTILVTPLIILFLIRYNRIHQKRTAWLYFGTALIITGAISNLIDRIWFGGTIDYLRLFTAVINLADILIVVGAGLLIWEEYKTK